MSKQSRLDAAAQLKAKLDLLHDEAQQLGLPLAAHLIGAAAEAVEEAVALSPRPLLRLVRKPD